MRRGDIGQFKFKVYERHNLVVERVGIICGVSKFCVFIFSVDGQLYRINRKYLLSAEKTKVSEEIAGMLEKYAKFYKEKVELEKPLREVERKLNQIEASFAQRNAFSSDGVV